MRAGLDAWIAGVTDIELTLLAAKPLSLPSFRVTAPLVATGRSVPRLSREIPRGAGAGARTSRPELVRSSPFNRSFGRPVLAACATAWIVSEPQYQNANGSRNFARDHGTESVAPCQW